MLEGILGIKRDFFGLLSAGYQQKREGKEE